MDIILFDEGFVALENVADDGQDAVPCPRAQCCVSDKRKDRHLRQSSRYGDELPNAGYQSPYKGGTVAVLVEIVFCPLDLVAIEQKQMPDLAVGEPIYDGASQKEREVVVDKGTDNRS